MDPLTALTCAHVGEKALSYVEDKFGELVIKRWTRRRAENFLRTFFQAVQDEAAGGDSALADAKLTLILEDEVKSELLFESYRKTVLSASKELGPRVIGLLTAHLVLEERTAKWSEEKVFAAAEQLDDDELRSFVEDYSTVVRRSRSEKVGDTIRIESGDDSYDFSRDFNIALSPSDVEDAGTWATKLRNLGLIHLEVRQVQWSYRENGERYIDQDGVAGRVTTYWNYSAACSLLSDYVQRVDKPAPGRASEGRN